MKAAIFWLSFAVEKLIQALDAYVSLAAAAAR